MRMSWVVCLLSVLLPGAALIAPRWTRIVVCCVRTVNTLAWNPTKMRVSLQLSTVRDFVWVFGSCVRWECSFFPERFWDFPSSLCWDLSSITGFSFCFTSLTCLSSVTLRNHFKRICPCPSEWQCKSCTVMNAGSSVLCEVCERPRLATRPLVTPSHPPVTPPRPPAPVLGMPGDPDSQVSHTCVCGDHRHMSTSLILSDITLRIMNCENEMGQPYGL